MVTIDEIVEPTAVQLGFSEPIVDDEQRGLLGHASASWGDWDGGIIGGTPSWLNPRDLPKGPLICTACAAPLRFICQLYAPADEVNPDAYHRSLYAFGCPVCCSQQRPEGSIRVLRCQLPLENDFYPPTEEQGSDATDDWKQHKSTAHGVDLCQVCGQRGKGKCPIQKVPFCGRHHQKEHKKCVFDKETITADATTTESTPFLPSIYTKSELVVDEEPPPEDGKEEEREALMPSEEENDPDLDLEQDDLDDMAGKKYKTTQDPVTTDFSARVKRAQDQCLRYYPKWQSPHEGDALWIRSEPVPTEVPPCRHCGAEQKCEFQIMPQMLYHLLEGHRKQKADEPIVSVEGRHALSVASEIVEYAPPEHVPPALKERHDETVAKIQKQFLESDANELDWGMIAVYTCTKSCSRGDGEDDDELGAYREEYAWKQPPQ